MKQFMKITYIAIIASALLTTGIIPIGVAHASQGIPVSGTVYLGPVIGIPEIRVADGNTFITRFREVTMEGTFTGTGINYQHIIIQANGALLFQEFSTFTGTVDGVGKGTLYSRVVGKGTLSPSYYFEARSMILSGSGDLSNVHGVIDYVLQPDGSLSYTGQIHFDP